MRDAGRRDHAIEAMARFLAGFVNHGADEDDMLWQVAEFFVDEAERRVKEAASWRDIPDA